jgi:hypothetical protein
MALGAERSSVILLVARYTAVLVLCGTAMGVPAALALSKLVKSFLFVSVPGSSLPSTRLECSYP